MNESTSEIERVFLLDRMPELDIESELWVIEQGYLLPAQDGFPGVAPEGRIRRCELPDGTVQYTHTIKKGMGLVREEYEREVTQEAFDLFWPDTKGRRIRKQRTRVPVGDFVWELDCFQGIDLVLAEIELQDPDTPVDIPDWLQPRILREVTSDPKYRNFELACAEFVVSGGKDLT
jgi:CYTH domain-containing protein